MQKKTKMVLTRIWKSLSTITSKKMKSNDPNCKTISQYLYSEGEVFEKFLKDLWVQDKEVLSILLPFQSIIPFPLANASCY